jgi:menaquinone-dependent protoporphyrinogen oxidase
MQVLVAYGSKQGATQKIAQLIGQVLATFDIEADIRSTLEVRSIGRYSAVIVGGTLYANWWHMRARRFVKGHAAELQSKPVWFFSDGHAGELPSAPLKQIKRLMERIGAQGYAGFSGHLDADENPLRSPVRDSELEVAWYELEKILHWVTLIARVLQSTEAHSHEIAA